MIKILALSGSLRARSFNTLLLQAAQAIAPADCIFEFASMKDIPLYDQDEEDKAGIPPAVVTLKEQIKAADGLLISTPEYNHGIPGVLKNTIDWLSRPPKDIPEIFHGRKIGLMGASPGRFGTAFAQTMWLPTLRYLNVNLFPKQLFVALVNSLFNEQGELIDLTMKKLLQDYMEGFVDFLQQK